MPKSCLPTGELGDELWVADFSQLTASKQIDFSSHHAPPPTRYLSVWPLLLERLF